jgi:DNA repair exonuclease SbcCD nuclease subunit
MAIRFVHAADLHLDSPFLGLAGSAPEPVARTLRDATFEAYEAIIDLCIHERVEALLIAGDIYDGADRSLRAQRRFIAGLNRLHQAGIRSFVCHGNHDPLDGWEAGLTMPESCHRFGPEVESVPFDPADPSRGMVYGMSYPRQSVKENVARRFHREHPGGVAIGLLHCNVGTDTGHEPYAPCTVDDLVAAGMDYWALGHVHTAQILRSQSPAVVYPGNPQGRHPKETGPRGACLVNIDDVGRVTIESRALDVVRWARVSVSIEGSDDIEDLMTSLESAVADALEEADGRHLVYRLALTGQGELHHELHRPGVVDELSAQRNEAIGWPFAWCARIEDMTRPAFDRQQALGAGDFLSEVLEAVDAARGDPVAQSELAEGLDVFYAHDRARKYLKDARPAGDEFDRLLTEAETRIADLLGGGA